MDVPGDSRLRLRRRRNDNDKRKLTKGVAQWSIELEPLLRHYKRRQILPDRGSFKSVGRPDPNRRDKKRTGMDVPGDSRLRLRRRRPCFLVVCAMILPAKYCTPGRTSSTVIARSSTNLPIGGTDHDELLFAAARLAPRGLEGTARDQRT